MVYVFVSFVSLLPSVIVAVASGIRPNDRPNIKLFILFIWRRSFPCLFLFWSFRVSWSIYFAFAFWCCCLIPEVCLGVVRRFFLRVLIFVS